MDILIPLGKQAKDGHAVVDAEFSYLLKYRWSITHYGYARRSRDKQLLHRLIMKAKLGQAIDHIDGDKLNNRVSNLRFCSQAENSRNQTLKRNNTSGYKGVSIIRSTKKWATQVKIDYKKYYFGCYDTAEEAASIYDTVALQLHGEFARLNYGS